MRSVLPSSQSRLRTADRHWVCLDGVGASLLPPHGFRWSRTLPHGRCLCRSGSVSAVNPLVARLKTVMKMHRCLQATRHSRTPTFSACLPACLLKSDDGPSHFKHSIHEPPSAIDVEGEPRPVLPSRTPRKRFFYEHELGQYICS